MNNNIVSTDKIVIEINLLGQLGSRFSTVTGRKKKVIVNDELIYEEYESYPQFSRTTKTAVLLNELERHLSFRQHTKSGEQGRSYGRNFVSRVKIILSKLLLRLSISRSSFLMFVSKISS